VTELQKVESIVTADSEEEALAKLSTNEFDRFLIVKKELQDINLGRPEFEEIN